MPPNYQFVSIAVYAHRLQLQKRLTHQIADEIQRVTASNDVMVVGSGQHLCVCKRGIKTDARRCAHAPILAQIVVLVI
jgi:GTP cyclohydrolase I